LVMAGLLAAAFAAAQETLNPSPQS